MKYMGAYMMAVIGGKAAPTAKDIKDILDAGGISSEKAMLDLVVKRMEGKTVHELIEAGSKKFAATGGGGGGGGGGAPAAAAAGGGGAAAAAPAKAVEEEEEDDAGGDFDLFG